MKSTSANRAGAPLAPAILAAVLAAISSAQERVPGPLPPSIDVKTAAEPSHSTGEMPARPAHFRPTTPAPKSGVASKPGAQTKLDRSHMYYANGEDGAVWARGIDYKASFGASGATYYPLFGRNQAQSLPHALSPDVVSVGGESLPFEREALAVRNADSVAIDRGSFVESYALAPQSIEQTFVFTSLPRAGDLVVHIPVGSALEARGCDGGLEFKGENGRVTYGRATAIDARGVHAPAATLLEDGAITIRVDAGFLATAELPLVIDPIVTTLAIDVSGHDNYWADAAYDASTHKWLVVYEEWINISDRDCFATYLDDNGATVGSFYLDLSTNAWDTVHCANNNSVDQFLVVASVTSGSQVYVLGQTIYSAGLQLGTQVVITGTEFGLVSSCVVGGDPYTPVGASYYCVVYERRYSSSDWDILVRLVRPDGTLVGAGPTYLSNSGGTIDIAPAVSKSNGTHDWMVVWQRDNGVNNSQDVWGGIIHWDGTTFAQPFLISAWFQDEWLPAVSSPLNGTMKYLATWQVTDGGDHDIIMALLDGSTKLDQQDLSIQEQYNYLLDQIDSTVDSDGDHFLVAYSEQYSGVDYDIYGADVHVNGSTLALAQRHVKLEYDITRDHTPRIVSAFSSGSVSTTGLLRRRYLAAWNTTPNGGGPADVEGAFMDSLAGGPSSPFCFGDGSGPACPCGNSGTSGHGCANSTNAAGALLTLSGNAVASADSVVLHVSGVPPTATCTFFQGMSGTDGGVFGDGIRCTSGLQRRLGTINASAGSASYPGAGQPSVSFQGSVPAYGATRTYQVLYRNSAVFCTTATFNISNGMIVVWTP